MLGGSQLSTETSPMRVVIRHLIDVVFIISILSLQACEGLRIGLIKKQRLAFGQKSGCRWSRSRDYRDDIHLLSAQTDSSRENNVKLSSTDSLPAVSKVSMRLAEVADTALILTFIKELARFEEMEDSVVATVSILQESLFPSDPSVKSNAEVVILEIDGKPAGFSLYFYNFSTFMGKQGLYIEDLYVREEYRGKGYGSQLLRHICRNAEKKDCGRVEWWCLDWNERAIKFYLGLGAEAMTDWTVYRLSEDKIRETAANPTF